jgi:FKBP-type peptidyl-prolyl cis-trans isomerase FkpA
MSFLYRLFQRSQPAAPRRRRSSGTGWAPESLERRLAFDANLAIAIQDGVATYQPGTESVYTVIITNNGEDGAAGTRIVAPLPTGVASANWTAQYSPGATGPASGSDAAGDAVFATINLPAGESAIFAVNALIEQTAVADVTFEVEARVGLGVTDSDLSNNVAEDTNIKYRPSQIIGPALVVGSDVGFRSAPTVTVIDPVSGQELNQFLAFDSDFRGGVSTAVADVDEDGSVEIIAASGPGKGEIRVFELDGTELPEYRLNPFGDSYFAGLSIAFGDFDGDGNGDLAVGKARGADVALFSIFNGWIPILLPFSFQPYGSSHVNGVTLAAADIGVVAGGVIQDATVADGKHELVVGTGAGVSRSVQVMSLAGGTTVLYEIPSRAAYGLTGLVVAAARFDSDAIDDIFVSGGRGSSAVTDVFSGRLPTGGGLLQRFEAPVASSATNARSYASGIDLDGDGQIDQVYSLSGPGSERGAVVFGLDGQRQDEETNRIEILRGPLRAAVGARPTAAFDPTLVTTASGLQYRDLVVGSGAVATAGQSVTVEYVGSRQNGEVFDTSRVDKGPDRPATPLSFTLGVGSVIAGWDEGVAGMQVGGSRTLIIPAELAYGDNAPGSVIQPGDTLVFDVELLSAGRGSLTPN